MLVFVSARANEGDARTAARSRVHESVSRGSLSRVDVEARPERRRRPSSRLPRPPRSFRPATTRVFFVSHVAVMRAEGTRRPESLGGWHACAKLKTSSSDMMLTSSRARRWKIGMEKAWKRSFRMLLTGLVASSSYEPLTRRTLLKQPGCLHDRGPSRQARQPGTKVACSTGRV